MPRDHPRVLRPPRIDVERGACTDAACIDEVRVCLADGGSCAEVTLACNVARKDCEITSIDGDPELVRQSLRLLPGRANEHALLYVTADAQAGSLVSELYAGGAPIAAGYHLLQRRMSKEEARERMLHCEVSSQRVVLGRYNQELGRSFPRVDELIDDLIHTRFNAKHGTHHEDVSDIGFDALATSDVLEEVYSEFMARVVEDMLARNCLFDAAEFAVIGAPGSRTLTVPLADPPPKVGDVFLTGTPWRVDDSPFDCGRRIADGPAFRCASGDVALRRYITAATHQ